MINKTMHRSRDHACCITLERDRLKDTTKMLMQFIKSANYSYKSDLELAKKVIERAEGQL